MSKSTFQMPATAMHDFYKTNGTGSHSIDCGESLTRQEFKDECDINALMARYEAHNTSINGLVNPLPPMYVDFTEIPDTLLGYMEFMDNAQAAFMTLPAAVRREFDNSAHLFCEYASDPHNVDQMVAWGLAQAKPKPADAETGTPGASPAPTPAPAPEAPKAS